MTAATTNARSDTIRICPDPIFIIGSPRSGTSILAWALAQHSRLWTSAESKILYVLFGRGQLGQAFEWVKNDPTVSLIKKENVQRREFLEFVGSGFNALFTSRSGGRRWIESSPNYTLIVDLLADMFPGAVFVHIVRDGRSTVHSMVHFLNRHHDLYGDEARKAGFLPKWATDFRKACRTWRNYVELSRDFCSRLPDRSLTIAYEDLMADPVMSFGRLFAFLQVTPEDAPVRFFRTKRINSSFYRNAAEAVNVRSPSEIWDGWTRKERRIFEREAGGTLVRR